MHGKAVPVTAVEAALARRRRWLGPLALLLALFLLAGAILLAWGAVLVVRYRKSPESTPYFTDTVEHFKYGSIGSEVPSGLPYWVWQALPRIFPEEFGGRRDYTAFGFLYEQDSDGRQRDLPVGISRRTYRGIDMVWFNCAVCHVGTWRPDAAATRPNLVAAMPSNNLDLGRFIRFLLGTAASDPRLKPEVLVAKLREAGADLGFADRLIWTYYVAPAVREGLLERQARLMPLLREQPPWGPGRVDTFNPYKLIQFLIPAAQLTPEERIGASDFPSVFLQRPRQGMQLHWDGNNTSLMERNLSAAVGAGVTRDTVDVVAIQRVSDWLLDLSPPASPLRPDGGAVARGQEVYMQHCAACHGYRSERGYVFEGAYLGNVTPAAEIGTDRGRLDSYTEAFRRRQLDEIFEGTPYDFKYFRKTTGYANQPLDGLWLRAPYLHNGSVPTLADLLEPPQRRPVAFLRGFDILDHARGGFLAPACGEAASAGIPAGTLSRPPFCFDTRLRGNGNGGHLYGTDLPAATKADLLAYLKTF